MKKTEGFKSLEAVERERERESYSLNTRKRDVNVKEFIRKDNERRVFRYKEILSQKERQMAGITLIALVITVIVILLLAGVSITMISGNNGILTKVGEASEAQKDAVEDEEVKMAVITAIASDDFGKLTDANLRNAITNAFGNPDKLTGTGPWTYEGERNKYNIDEDGNVTLYIDLRPGIEVGDYVDYVPDGGTYDISRLTTYSGSSSNGSDNLTLTNMGSLKWRVLRKYDDGSIDLIGDPTDKTIYFSGALGYNNGVYLMHDICETLYSNSRLGVTARSVNLEDMEKWLTTAGISKRNSYSNEVQYGSTKKYRVYDSYYPILYAQERLSGVDSDTVREAGIKDQDKYYTSLGELISTEEQGSSYDQASTNGLTVTQTFYNISINSTNYGDGYIVLYNSSYQYWVASRYVITDSNVANFGLRYASTYMSGCYMFLSNERASGGFYRLRPIVSLGSDIQITPCSGTNSSSNMHSIAY